MLQIHRAAVEGQMSAGRSPPLHLAKPLIPGLPIPAHPEPKVLSVKGLSMNAHNPIAFNVLGLAVLTLVFACNSVAPSGAGGADDTGDGGANQGGGIGSEAVLLEKTFAWGDFVERNSLSFTPTASGTEVIVTITNDVPESTTYALVHEADHLLALTPRIGSAGTIRLTFTTLNTAVHTLALNPMELEFLDDSLPITYTVRVTERG
jgi:hypothetical protein